MNKRKIIAILTSARSHVKKCKALFEEMRRYREAWRTQWGKGCATPSYGYLFKDILNGRFLPKEVVLSPRLCWLICEELLEEHSFELANIQQEWKYGSRFKKAS